VNFVIVSTQSNSTLPTRWWRRKSWNCSISNYLFNLFFCNF